MKQQNSLALESVNFKVLGISSDIVISVFRRRVCSLIKLIGYGNLNKLELMYRLYQGNRLIQRIL
jgi:hypothetical protein